MKVYRYLSGIGVQGATDYEIGEALGILRTSAGKRRKELCELGLVEDTGRRRPTDTGVHGIVWATTDGQTPLVVDHLRVHKSKSNPHWRSPEEGCLELVREFGDGVIGFDPCGAPDGIDLVRAQAACRGRGPDDDGLLVSWSGKGLTYCNPPYSDAREEDEESGETRAVMLYGDVPILGSPHWIAKAKREVAESILLVAARPDTVWFQDCGASRVCFKRGRLKFEGAKDPAPFPSAFLYFGLRGDRFEAIFRRVGRVVPWR